MARQRDEEQPGETADSEDGDDDEEDVFDEVSKFDDTKRKLRMVLCRADFQSLPWLKSSENQGRRRYGSVSARGLGEYGTVSAATLVCQ